jgi:hypothetical protein
VPRTQVLGPFLTLGIVCLFIEVTITHNARQDKREHCDIRQRMKDNYSQ